MATTTTRKTYSHPHLVERRVAQWHEPARRPSERRKRLLSLHCGLVNALFAVADFSTPAREVTSLLLDVSQGQTTITIPDTELIKILKAKESGLTDAAARKRLQRGFAALIRDQLRAESTFIACCRGDKIKVWDGERMVEQYKDSSYDLSNIWGILTAALGVAQPELRLAQDRPELLQAAIQEVLPDFPNMAPRRTHKRKGPPSRDELIERDKATFKNAARRIFEYASGTEEERRAELMKLIDEALAPPSPEPPQATAEPALFAGRSPAKRQTEGTSGDLFKAQGGGQFVHYR